MNLKETDWIEVKRDREEYAKRGVYKGMVGYVALSHSISGEWDIIFPGYGANDDISEASIHENDMIIPPEDKDEANNDRIYIRHDGVWKHEIVRVTVKNDREEYAKHGVYSGMSGMLWHTVRLDGTWLVKIDTDKNEDGFALLTMNESDIAFQDTIPNNWG